MSIKDNEPSISDSSFRKTIVERSPDDPVIVLEKDRVYAQEPRKTGVPEEIKFLRQELKSNVIKVAYELLDPIENVKKPKSEQSKLQYLVNKAVAKGNYQFIQDLLDQAIGKAITPVVAKHVDDVRPKTVIRRVDGTIVEYTIQDKEQEE